MLSALASPPRAGPRLDPGWRGNLDDIRFSFFDAFPDCLVIAQIHLPFVIRNYSGMVLGAPQVAAQAYFDENKPHLGRLHMENHRNFGLFRHRWWFLFK